MESELIKFQVQTDRIISLLSNEIYDSSCALLRENVQNAYDAVLMRKIIDRNFSPRIEVSLIEKVLTISDNGIGMTRSVLENNFWKAGSSGKNTEAARKAGVVGTFGIGAMANFGVCEKLEVITRSIEGDDVYYTGVEKKNLSLSEKCVNLKKLDESEPVGTTVKATLQDDITLTLDDAKSYLKTFVQFLDVPVVFNDEIISQNKYYDVQTPSNTIREHLNVHQGLYSFDLDITIANYNSGIITVYANGIKHGDCSISGDLYLKQGQMVFHGLRNGFGLASMPIQSIYSLGGYVNLTTIRPTAGRDAICKESIDFVQQLVTIIEMKVSECLAKYDIADQNKDFLTYIWKTKRLDLCNKIKIQEYKDKYWAFEQVEQTINGRKCQYYTGDDSTIMALYSNESSILLLPSKDTIRKNIQISMLTRKGIPMISREPKVIREYDMNDLSDFELTLKIRLAYVLDEDYLLSNSKVEFADITSGVPYLVQIKDNELNLYLVRDTSNIMTLKCMYDKDPRMFTAFVKDFVRCQLYPLFAQYIPSSSKQGADALYRALMRNKELYTIDKEEKGDVESELRDWIKSGKSVEEISKHLDKIQSTHKQIVQPNQVGSVELELYDMVSRIERSSDNNHHIDTNNQPGIEFVPAPPIRIPNCKTKMKILKAQIKYSLLNNYETFLALSNNVVQQHGILFSQPHSTKVMWSMHKVVYIFTHISGKISLYYEIELQTKLPDSITGGAAIPTTTLITDDKIFVPVVKELEPYFSIVSNSLSFYVRYDEIFDTDSK